MISEGRVFNSPIQQLLTVLSTHPQNCAEGQAACAQCDGGFADDSIAVTHMSACSRTSAIRVTNDPLRRMCYF
jgi:hypothetical protein